MVVNCFVFMVQKAVAAIMNDMYIRTRPVKNAMVSIAPMIIIVPAALNRRSPERFAMSWNAFLKYMAISKLNMNTIARNGRKYGLLKTWYCMSNMPVLWLNSWPMLRMRLMMSVTEMSVM